jgi:hypothetical protein
MIACPPLVSRRGGLAVPRAVVSSRAKSRDPLRIPPNDRDCSAGDEVIRAMNVLEVESRVPRVRSKDRVGGTRLIANFERK